MAKSYIRCGDCLELMKNIPDKSVDMILCDLPYGTTACKWDVIVPFEPLWQQYKRIIKNNRAIVLFGSEPFSSKLRMSNLKMYKYDWVWEKEQGANFLKCRTQPYRVHENILVFSVGKCLYNPQMTKGKPYVSGKGDSGEVTGKVKKTQTRNTGTRYPRSVQKFATEKRSSVHPTQKPVALLEYLIRTYTNPGDTVLDNCMGSGSTGIACIRTKRNFIGFEKDKNYFLISRQRLKEERKLLNS